MTKTFVIPFMTRRYERLFSNQRIRNIVFIRHANTIQPNLKNTKLSKEELDLQRNVSELGKKQCALAVNTWFKSFQFAPLIISSKAQRCKDTASVLLGKEMKNFVVQESSTIYPTSEQNQETEKLFSQIGYNSLRKFHEKGGGKALEIYAESVLEELYKMIEKEEPMPRKQPDLMVLGHAVYTNAIVYRLARYLKLPNDYLQLVLDTNLGEVEAFSISIDQIFHHHTRDQQQ